MLVGRRIYAAGSAAVRLRASHTKKKGKGNQKKSQEQNESPPKKKASPPGIEPASRLSDDASSMGCSILLRARAGARPPQPIATTTREPGASMRRNPRRPPRPGGRYTAGRARGAWSTRPRYDYYTHPEPFAFNQFRGAAKKFRRSAPTPPASSSRERRRSASRCAREP